MGRKHRDDVDEVFDPTPKGGPRFCVKCERQLSSFNTSDACFSHREEEDRLSERATQSNVVQVEKQPGMEVALSATPQGGKWTGEDIFTAVTAATGVTHEDLRSPVREQPLARVRQVVMYLLRTDLKKSFPAIARMLGRKDHTTVLHGCRLIEDMSSSDNGIRHMINDIRAHYPKTAST